MNEGDNEEGTVTIAFEVSEVFLAALGRGDGWARERAEEIVRVQCDRLTAAGGEIGGRG